MSKLIVEERQAWGNEVFRLPYKIKWESDYQLSENAKALNWHWESFPQLAKILPDI